MTHMLIVLCRHKTSEHIWLLSTCSSIGPNPLPHKLASKHRAQITDQLQHSVYPDPQNWVPYIAQALDTTSDIVVRHSFQSPGYGPIHKPYPEPLPGRVIGRRGGFWGCWRGLTPGAPLPPWNSERVRTPTFPGDWNLGDIIAGPAETIEVLGEGLL